MWQDTPVGDMIECALSPSDAKDVSIWRGRILGAKRPIQTDLVPGYAIGVLANGSAVKPKGMRVYTVGGRQANIGMWFALHGSRSNRYSSKYQTNEYRVLISVKAKSKMTA
jgi:hypothetical protein